MHLIAFSVHDSKADAFIQPFFTPTVAVGQRFFSQACNDPECNFSIFPDDFTLFEVGTFDCSNGKFEALPTPKSHGLAIMFKSAPSALQLVQGEGN